MVDSPGARVRLDYRLGVEVFVEVLDSLPPDRWHRPALGAWNLLDLVGHTSRSLITVESYLDSTSTTLAPEIADAAAYYRAAAVALADPDAVAERGRQAGAALGNDPVGAVAAIAERVLRLVEVSDDEATVNTPVGSMTLVGYLPSRTFELAVHSLDIITASGGPAPERLATPLAAAAHLAVDLAIANGQGTDVVLALTGRRRLPEHFTVLGA